VLKFKPQGKKSKTLQLQVNKEPEPIVDVPDANNFRVEADRFPEVLWKGLYCSASWDAADPTETKPSSKKNLVRLSLTTIEVIGKIKEIKGDSIVLKAKPKNDRPWPDMEENEKSSTPCLVQHRIPTQPLRRRPRPGPEPLPRRRVLKSQRRYSSKTSILRSSTESLVLPTQGISHWELTTSKPVNPSKPRSSMEAPTASWSCSAAATTKVAPTATRRIRAAGVAERANRVPTASGVPSPLMPMTALKCRSFDGPRPV
jgi:hypothetical protein